MLKEKNTTKEVTAEVGGYMGMSKNAVTYSLENGKLNYTLYSSDCSGGMSNYFIVTLRYLNFSCSITFSVYGTISW